MVANHFELEANMASIRERKTKKGIKYTVLYDYMDADGERKQKSAGTFDSKKDAEEAQLDIDLKKKRNQFITPSKETVSEFIYRWIPLRAKLKKWEYNYLDSATRLLEKHVMPCIGNIPIQEVLPFHIDSMFSELQEKRCDGPKSYNREEEDIPFLSGSTLGSIYTLVKCFFDAAVKWEVIESNPVKLDKPERDEVEDMTVWDLEMTVTALARIKHEQLHLMVHIASAHTCRNGEICGLTWDVIDVDKGLMKIDKTMQRVNKKAFNQLPKKEVFRIFPNKVGDSKSFLVLKTPKTKGSIRWLHLTKPIVEELKRRKQQVVKDKLYYGDGYTDNNLVFCMEDGSPIEPNLAERWFKKWQKRNGEELGIPIIKFHWLRHSAITLLMYLSGSDAKTVQTITGHDSAQFVFDVYNHPLMNHQKLLIEKLECAMYGNPQQTQQQNKTADLSVEDIIESIRKDPKMAQEVFTALHAEVALPA